MSSKHTSAPWLQTAVTQEGMAQIVRDAVEKLRGLDFDTIAFRGMSGALIAPIIAHELKKEIAMIRKEGVQTHSCNSYEGYQDVKRYVIVDDFVSTGATIGVIMQAVRHNNSNTSVRLAGIYTYYSSWECESGLHIPGEPKFFACSFIQKELAKEEGDFNG